MAVAYTTSFHFGEVFQNSRKVTTISFVGDSVDNDVILTSNTSTFTFLYNGSSVSTLSFIVSANTTTNITAIFYPTSIQQYSASITVTVRTSASTSIIMTGEGIESTMTQFGDSSIFMVNELTATNTDALGVHPPKEDEQNVNALQQNTFTVTIQPKENANNSCITFHTKSVPMPGVRHQKVNIETRVNNIEFPVGGKPQREAFSITLILDDKLLNYFQLRKWHSNIASQDTLKLESNPDQAIRNRVPDLKQFDVTNWIGNGDFNKIQNTITGDRQSWSAIDYRDIMIELKNNNHQCIGFLKLIEAWPEDIPSFNLNVSSSDPVEITVSFSYLYHEMWSADLQTRLL